MRRVRHDDHAVKQFLHCRIRPVQMFPGFDNGRDLVIIAHYTAQIDRDNYFGALGNGVCKLVIIHLIGTGCRIHQNDFRPDMVDDGCGCRIGIGRSDHLIPRAHAQQVKRHLHGCGRRIKTYRLGGTTILRDLLFEELRLWTCRDPPGLEGCDNLVYF